MMEKISFKSLSKFHQIIIILCFIFLVAIFSIIWGKIFAQESPTDPTTTTPTIPNAPTGLSLNGTATTTSVPLVWTDNADNEDKFNVDRKLSTATDWTGAWSIQLTSANTTTYTDTSVAAGTTYDYRVQACLSGTGCSDYSFLTGVSTPTPTPVPTIPLAPTGMMLNGTPTTTSVPLKWTDNANNEDKFNVDRKLSSATTWTNLTQITVANTTTYTDGSAVAGTTYDYRVQACLSGTGCSEYTTLANISTPTTTTTTSVPLAPTGLILNSTPLPASVQLRWTDNATNEDRFSVQRKLSSTSWSDTGAIVSFLISQANATSYVDTTAAASMTYDYRVTACLTGVGCSEFTYLSGVSITTSGYLPYPPSSVTASSTAAGKITVSWTSSAAKYILYRSVNGAAYLLWNTNMTSLYFDDLNVTTGSTYRYKVKGCNSDGTTCSTIETESNLLTYNGGAVSCTSLTLTLAGGKTTYTIGESVNYTWTCYPGGVASYVSIWLQKPTGAPVNYNSTTNSGSQTLGFSTSNLVPGTHILKACFDSACTTAIASQTFNVVTTTANTTTTNIPNPPTGLVLNGATTPTSVPLRWTDNSTNEDFFRIERKLTSAVTYMTVMQTTPNVVTFFDTNVTPGNYYDYRVSACYLGNCSSYAYLNGISTPVSGVGYNVPNAPTELSLGGSVVARSVPLHWTDNSSNEDSFKIERKLSTATAFAFISQVGTNITSYTDTTAAAGVTYDYRVQSCLNSVGCSTYTTLAGVAVTSAPTNPATTNGTTSGSGSCTSLTLTLAGGKTTYTIGESVNYTWTCYPGGVASYVSIWLQKPTGAPVNYNSTTNSGSQTLGFSTSNLVPGTHILKACFDSACTTAIASQTFNVGTSYVAPSTTKSSTTPPLSATTTSPPSVTSTTPPTTTPATTPKTATTATTPSSAGATAAGDGILSPPASAPVLSATKNTTTGTTTSATTNSTAPANNPETSQATSQPTSTPIAAPTTPATVFSSNVEDLGTIIEERNTTIDTSKEQLAKIINDSVGEIVKNAPASEQKVNVLRDQLLKNVDSSLSAPSIAAADINNLKTDISAGIKEMQTTAASSGSPVNSGGASLEQIASTLNTLSDKVNDQSQALKQQGGDLLYKDSNKDGISDYESVHVYNMNPILPSPTSLYEGKKITASEKVLLGFDPTKSEIVKVEKQQPQISPAPVVATYKVKEVALTEKKGIVLKGQALPNSFITVYIYSTPIMVTVKADSNGEWQYVLDKELENGDHTVYTATVNNSGGIIAKSSGYLFTKTAEAVTLKDMSLIGVPMTANKPSLAGDNNVYLLVSIFVIGMILILILVGMTSRKNKEETVSIEKKEK